ncbi:hypothetical protein [Pseudomonas sp.]|uniref:hypothetical protein n=1 Tax=Pseudomonas sp. TaxID=306 RepID=UPI002733BD6A|nr:hypothetical protein [Pseudomonas sp.]MDP3816687.1 hypothetical protein [Pseudomonas sp.]
MPKFQWHGGWGDDAAHKPGWRSVLPPPPAQVYALLDRAKAVGLWLRWARDPTAKRRFGGRYRLVKAGTEDALLITDDLDLIAAHLNRLR